MTASSVSAELKDLKTRVDLLAAQQEDYMKAVNDLSEDVSKDIDNLYLAIGELAKKLEEKKKAPMPRIGYKTKKP